mgnify:CR=1 FL=1
MKVIVDAMGGDNAPLEIVRGALAAHKNQGVEILLVGRTAEILRAVEACGEKTLPAGVQSSLHLDRLVAFARQYLPLFDLNLGWLLPACLGFVIGLVIHFSGRKSR